MVPFAVVEAVSAFVWSHAKANGKRAAASSPPTPPRKRRRASPVEHGCVDRRGVLPTFQLSQLSQTQPDEDTVPSVEAELLAQTRKVFDTTMHDTGSIEGDAPAEVWNNVRNMTLAAVSYWREVSLQDLSKACGYLARFAEHQRRLYWKHPRWHGVNLGGWLLVEPGPSAQFFDKHGPANCEWDLTQRMRERLGVEGTQQAFKEHRESFITEEDIRKIRAFGLNAVRVPIGYWGVESAEEDGFASPCVEFLDRVVEWCAAHGLQVLIDLHGAPGGESGERPCGRERTDWHWEDWRFDQSIALLRVLAQRYKGNPCVTGVSVCNEPSETVPAEKLCEFYDRAVTAVRESMPPDEVAISLPVYRSERLDDIWRIWCQSYDGFARHPNVCFDLHLYHCFGQWWQRQSLGQQLRMTKRHRKILRRVPAVVGEWSLALNPRAHAEAEGPAEEDQALRDFAAAQLDAYNQASHGWFFWNWRDSPKQPGWDLGNCIERRWLSHGQLCTNN